MGWLKGRIKNVVGEKCHTDNSINHNLSIENTIDILINKYEYDTDYVKDILGRKKEINMLLGGV